MTHHFKITPECPEKAKHLGDGSYFGFWGGHEVWFRARGEEIDLTCETAVRTPRCPVTIHKSGSDFTMQTDWLYSGQTTACSHKHGDWQKVPSDGQDAIKKMVIFEVQWSNCPIEVEHEIISLWSDRELGNDSSYYHWTSEDVKVYPIIAEYLSQRDISECLIHWWW